MRAAVVALLLAACGGGGSGGGGTLAELEPNDSPAAALLLAALGRGQSVAGVGMVEGGGAAPCHDFDYWEVQATEDGSLTVRLAATLGYSAGLSFSYSVSSGGGEHFIQAYDADAIRTFPVLAGDVVSVLVDAHWNVCNEEPYRLTVGME